MSNKQISKKHFVFDLDDTLIDGRQFCGESMVQAITANEPHVDTDDIMDFHERVRGQTVVDLYKAAIEKFDLKTDLNTLLKLDESIQKSEYSKMKLFDGVIDILEFLKNKGKKLHICTNRIESLLIPILESTEIDKYFDDVISCIDRGHKKPEPFCLLELVNGNGGNKDDFIYFGDSEIDSEFAKNSGIDFIIFDQYLNERNLFKKLVNMFLEEKINGNN
jgi:phosphoglycolate phosphatase